MKPLTGTIIAAPEELQAYKEALISMDISITGEKAIPDTKGNKNHRYEISFQYTNAAQVFEAGKLISTISKAIKSPKKQTFYLGNFETRRFMFYALSDSEEGVRNTIKKGWNKHCREFTHVDKSLLVEDDIIIAPVQLNKCLRDFEEF